MSVNLSFDSSTTTDVGREAAIVLIVDDDPDVHTLLSAALRPRLRIQSAQSASDGLMMSRAIRPDLVLLDLTLGDGSGIEVLTEIRAASDVPVIVISGDSRSESLVQSLRLGADDYVVKPFRLGEVEARVDAVLRRATRENGRSPISSYDDLMIDSRARQVFVNGEAIRLTATEFDLLAHLATWPRQVFTREDLLDAVWRSNPEWQTAATVTEHTRRLRSKLGPASKHIATVYGRGYRFDP